MRGNQLRLEKISGRRLFGQEARDLAKYIRSRLENKEIWDTTEVRQRSERRFLVPQDRDWETNTKQAVNVIKRTELTSSTGGIVMVNPRNLETVVSQRQSFPNPVVILLLGSREQIHEAFDLRPVHAKAVLEGRGQGRLFA